MVTRWDYVLQIQRAHLCIVPLKLMVGTTDLYESNLCNLQILLMCGWIRPSLTQRWLSLHGMDGCFCHTPSRHFWHHTQRTRSGFDEKKNSCENIASYSSS